jgi:hypothetical protein
MRMAFGLVSLLVCVGIMLWAMMGGDGAGGPGYLQTVSKANKQAKSQVNVIGGYDPTRQMLATDSIHYRIDRSSGRAKLIVTEVMPNGPMADRFGLVPNDRVVEIGSLDVNMNVSNFDDATAAFHDAYARGGTIVVMRENQKVTLPTPEHVAMIAERDRNALAAQASASASAAAAAAPSVPTDNRSAVQKAIDSVRTKPGN